MLICNSPLQGLPFFADHSPQDLRLMLLEGAIPNMDTLLVEAAHRD